MASFRCSGANFATHTWEGFTGVEFLFPYAHSANMLRKLLQECGLEQVLFNCPPGNWDGGERGVASLPGREEEFKRGAAQRSNTPWCLAPPRLQVMAGVLDHEQDRARHRDVYLGNLAYAAEQAGAQGTEILIEPINTRDMPGYFLTRQDDAHAICREVGAANLRVQCDVYHCQIVEGDVAARMRQNMGGIGHVQIAGVPERHEPDVGELNYPYLFRLLDELGYQGWVGCEYRPRAGTSEGLGWLRAALGQQSAPDTSHTKKLPL